MPIWPHSIRRWALRIAVGVVGLCVVAVVVLALAGRASIVGGREALQKRLEAFRSLEHPETHFDITELQLMGSDFDDQDVERLKRLPALTRLDIQSTKITDAGMIGVGEMSTLQSLILCETGVTETGLKQLKRLPNLRELMVGGDGPGPRITDAGLKEIAGCSQLRGLSVAGANNTEAGIREIGTLKDLRGLSLWAVNIQDDWLADLRNLEHLQSLTIGQPKTKFTGAGFRHLSAINGLDARLLGAN